MTFPSLLRHPCEPGIPTNLFTTHWTIPEWQAELEVSCRHHVLQVSYYWSDLTKWQSSSGTGKSVPVRCLIIKSMQLNIFKKPVWTPYLSGSEVTFKMLSKLSKFCGQYF